MSPEHRDIHDDPTALDPSPSVTLDGHSAIVRHQYGPAAALLLDGTGRPSGVVAAVDFTADQDVTGGAW
jgi:hypothetical protein